MWIDWRRATGEVNPISQEQTAKKSEISTKETSGDNETIKRFVGVPIFFFGWQIERWTNHNSTTGGREMGN